MATAKANGITLTYEASGNPQDTPVLLIMGLGMQLIAWPQDLVDGLVDQGYYVIRYDNRDIGLSSKFDHFKKPNLMLAYLKSLVGWRQSPAYTLNDMANDALGLLDALGIARAHVVGVSMGGMIAQIFAARFGARTLSLTSIMSSSGRRGLPGPTPAARAALMRGPGNASDRKEVIDHAVGVFRTIGSSSFPTPERQLRGNIERALNRSVDPAAAGIARQIVAVVASGDRTPLLRKIACPALVIHGAADPLVPVACGVDTAEAIPGAKLHVIEGMGHDLPPQLIERLLALLDNHLRGNMTPDLPALIARRAGSGTLNNSASPLSFTTELRIDLNTKKIGIAIVAPGGAAPNADALHGGIARLEQQGFLVHNYYEHDKRHLRFGGTDAGRLAQLDAAAADPDVQIVIALRGSYGMTRLLPHIDFAAMADSGKLFVGYSDFTAFQMALMKQTGRVSFAGPMICADFLPDEPDAYTLGQFWDCLRGPAHAVRGEVADGGADNPLVDVGGRLWGGNLAMMVSLLGTPYFHALEDGIVFIEDISEHPYRIERMVLQLLYAGALDGQRALVLGDFSGYKLGALENGYDFETMLAYLRERLPMPVLTGLPFGHIQRHATLPYGGMARLVSDARGFDLTIRDYPTL